MQIHLTPDTMNFTVSLNIALITLNQSQLTLNKAVTMERSQRSIETKRLSVTYLIRNKYEKL